MENKYIIALILLIGLNIFLIFFNINMSLARDESLVKMDFESGENIKKFIGDMSQPVFFQLPNSIIASILGIIFNKDMISFGADKVGCSRD